MRNLKRFLAMTLTMLMVVGCFVMTSSAKFDDVTDFQNEITILSNLGVIKGNADGTFGFDQAVTRRQEALFIARAATGKVTDTVWTGTINNTNFTDLDATGDYYGAISYCSNLGVIKGRTSTAFYPNDNIIFQEAVAMVVRALGYGSATMDAGYPYTYYDKAVSLGLDKGLENVALTDVVSRGVAAKLLYNTLFAINSDGVTMASSSFGAVVKSTNLVLVATSDKKLVTNYSLPTAAGTAAFCEFNSDGTFNFDKVYNLNWSDFSKLAFGADSTKKAADYVGASFAVTTVDGFKSLTSVTVNPSKTFTQADASGNGTIAGTAYTLVDKWTSVFNTNTTWDGKDEILQFNTAFTKGGLTGNTAFYGNHWYVVDSNNNILASNGSILLYYHPTTNSSAVFPFAYKLVVAGVDTYYPAYLPVDGSAYAGAATVDQLGAKATYATNYNAAKYTTNVNAYADTVAYDDNNDGAYDRAYFTNYTFGQFFTFSKDGHTYYNVTLGAKGSRVSPDNNIDGAIRGYKDIGLTNISGKEVKDGSYVLWARDAINGNLIIKKVFDTTKTGYVTGVNVIDKTITLIDSLSSYTLGFGTSQTVKYGVAKLPGATNTNDDLTINDDGTGKNLAETLIGISYTLQYKSISYIVDDEHDNKIIAIVGEKTADTPLVVTDDHNYYDYSVFGNLQLSVIDPSGTAQIITVSSVNNIPATFIYANDFENGDLIFGAKQDNGTWLITTAQDSKEYNYNAPLATVLTFNGGIAYENLNPITGENKTILDKAIPTPGNTFSLKPDGTTLVIIVNNPDGTFTVARGIPTNGSTLQISDHSNIYAKNGYMYVNGDAQFIGAGWNLSTGMTTGIASDVIYLKTVSNPMISANNSYTYTGTYFSIMTGKANGDIGAYITSSELLSAGSFYEVTTASQNGTTVIKVINNKVLTPVYIKSFGGNFAEIVDVNGVAVKYISGKNVKLYNWNNNDLATEITTQPGTGKLYQAYTYEGNVVNGNNQYFLVYNTYTIPAPVVGNSITSAKLGMAPGSVSTISSPAEGETILVTEIKTNESGTLKTYTPADAAFFNSAAFFWYKVDSNGTVATTPLASHANAYTVQSTDLGCTYKVVVVIPGYTAATATANTDTSGMMWKPAMKSPVTVTDDGAPVAGGATTIANGSTLAVSAITATNGPVIAGANTVYTWTRSDGTLLGNGANYITVAADVGKTITLTITDTSYTGTATWTSGAIA